MHVLVKEGTMYTLVSLCVRCSGVKSMREKGKKCIHFCVRSPALSLDRRLSSSISPPLITPSSVITTVVITSSGSLVSSSTLTHFLLDNSISLKNSFPGYFPFVLEFLTWSFYTSHSHFQVVFSLNLMSHLLFSYMIVDHFDF